MDPGLVDYGANKPVAFLWGVFIYRSHLVLSKKHFQGIPKDHASFLELSGFTSFTH